MAAALMASSKCWGRRREGVRRRFQVGQNNVLGFEPINVIGAVMGFPERAFFRLVGEIGYGFKTLAHGCNQIETSRKTFNDART